MTGVKKYPSEHNLIGLTVTVYNPFRDGLSPFVYGRVTDQDEHGFSVSCGGMMWDFKAVFIDPDLKIAKWRKITKK